MGRIPRADLVWVAFCGLELFLARSDLSPATFWTLSSLVFGSVILTLYWLDSDARREMDLHHRARPAAGTIMDLETAEDDDGRTLYWLVYEYEWDGEKYEGRVLAPEEPDEGPLWRFIGRRIELLVDPERPSISRIVGLADPPEDTPKDATRDAPSFS